MTESRQLVLGALVAVLLVAAFTRFYRLGVPNQCYFDEQYFPTQGAEVLHGDDTAWNFFGHENTHPPLSKEIMAFGMAIFGHQDRKGVDNSCWPDQEDAAKKADPDWIYEPFGWRFFGALAGVGAVVFIYLLAKKLFQSEVAGLTAAFLLTFDGLAFVQSRIATPDTYVLFFMLGAVYFLISDHLSIRRLLLSGLFFGAAVACKWVAALTIVPIMLYFLWVLVRHLQETKREERLRAAEAVMMVGAAVIAAGLGLVFGLFLFSGEVYFELFAIVLTGVLTMLGGLGTIALSSELRNFPRARLYLKAGLALPLCFLVVPLLVYAVTYIPMLLNGHDVGDALRLNRDAYNFHSNLRATHAYQSSWLQWVVMARPIFLYLGGGDEKIYSMGNPVIFWLGVPALVFVAYLGLRRILSLDTETGTVSFSGTLTRTEAALVFVVLAYLGFLLPWALNPRALFLYHYLPALAFLILALSYCVHWLWYHEEPWGRALAVAFLVTVALTFAFFYPHMAAVDVSHSLDERYYWFPNDVSRWIGANVLDKGDFMNWR